MNHFNLFGNSLFGRYEPSNGARRYYLKDNLGSTRMVTDNNGNILQTFDYYPFGLLMPGRNGGSGSTMEQFTGKELDNEGTQNLNLYYFGARYLDPAIGQWTSVDPLAKKYPGWSPYNYGLDDPIKIIDPNGKSANCCSYYPRSWEEFSLAMNRSIKDIKFKVNKTIKTFEKKSVKTVIYSSDNTSKATENTGKMGIGMAGVGLVGTVIPGVGETGGPEAYRRNWCSHCWIK